MSQKEISESRQLNMFNDTAMEMLIFAIVFVFSGLVFAGII